MAQVNNVVLDGNEVSWEDMFDATCGSCEHYCGGGKCLTKCDDDYSGWERKNELGGCMSRDEILKGLSDIINNGECVSQTQVLIGAVDLIKKTKKTAQWINHQNGKWVYAKCNKCGNVHDIKTNYCPDCGAFMDGGFEY